MSTKYSDVYAKCPYYVTEEGNYVYCEGYCKQNARIGLSFTHRKYKDLHLNAYCRKIVSAKYGFPECPVYKMLEKELEH